MGGSRLPRHAALLAVAVVAVAGAASAVAQQPAQSAPPAEGFSIRLVDIPTDRADDPRARTAVIDHVSPGTTFTRRVEVSNTTDGPISVSLYAAAASLSDGAFVFGEGRAANALSGWITLTPSTLDLASGASAFARATIAVPSLAEGGERYGVLWAEASSPSDGGVTLVNRVGVRVYLSVGAGAEPHSDFEIRTLTAGRDAEGNPVVHAEVENTGARALDLRGELELTDGPGALRAGPFAVEVGTTLAPGAAAPALVQLDESLPDGPWTATVTIRSGTLEKRATAEITFPSDRARTAAPTVARPAPGGSAESVRLGLAAATVAGVGIGVAVLLRRRRALRGGPRRPRGPREGRHGTARGDRLPSPPPPVGPTSARPREATRALVARGRRPLELRGRSRQARR